VITSARKTPVPLNTAIFLSKRAKHAVSSRPFHLTGFS
jgi:hypothetical protein